MQNMIWSFYPDKASETLTRQYFLKHAYQLTGGDWERVEKHNVAEQHFLKVEMNNKGEIMAKVNGEKKFVKFDCIVETLHISNRTVQVAKGTSAGRIP